MALTISNVKTEAVTSYMEGIRMMDPSWRLPFNFRNEPVSQIRIASMHTAGLLPEWDGAEDYATDTVDSIGALTLTATNYATQIRVGKRDVLHVPGIVGQAARKLGVAVAASYGNQAAGVLNNAAGSTTVVSGQALSSTTHTQHDGGTRSNQGTTAIDAAAVMAGITSQRNWESYRSTPYDLVAGGYWLVIPPALEEAASQAIASAYTSAALQVNVAGSFNIDIVVWSQLTDANNWFLVSKVDSPLWLWEGSAPTPVITQDQDNGATKISVDFALASSAGPEPDGIFCGIVA